MYLYLQMCGGGLTALRYDDGKYGISSMMSGWPSQTLHREHIAVCFLLILTARLFTDEF